MSRFYRTAECAGEENVRKAIEKITGTDDEKGQWLVHSITPAGVKQHQHPISGQNIVIMNYLVLFERDVFDA